MSFDVDAACSGTIGYLERTSVGLSPAELERVSAAMRTWDAAQHHAARVWAKDPTQPEPGFLTFARGA